MFADGNLIVWVQYGDFIWDLKLFQKSRVGRVLKSDLNVFLKALFKAFLKSHLKSSLKIYQKLKAFLKLTWKLLLKAFLIALSKTC